MIKLLSLCAGIMLTLSGAQARQALSGAQARQAQPESIDNASQTSQCPTLWGGISYHGAPWVTNVSSRSEAPKGLQGRHLSVWASHGRYYDGSRGKWIWQRPLLYSTTEDLFTQTIVVPYLIPMLERAGANVFTPRERDWQQMEYIVDPDGGLNASASCYAECAGKWKAAAQPGFAAHAGTYQDGENPFEAGGARQIKVTKKAGKAFVKWQPYFVKGGKYAVYVSYATLAKSIDDAHYTVFHQGVATEFRVNQRMGGGTWVYLGTFTFDEGSSVDNCVMLSNQSQHKGIVTADAVRFGGGIGNIERGGSTSGYPRAVEGARYWAQWAGAPYDVYGGRKGSDDYSDDINARSLMTNWLAGGSVYNPIQDGKGVPIELSLAVHSDAGFNPDGKTPWGSLAVCTTDFNDGQLASGVTRQASKIFARNLLDNLVSDLSPKYKAWPKRYLWDRNYSESRLPAVPSAIIETLSHQSFPDMLLGQDPNFRFDMARSIYKTIARFVNGMHGEPTVIEPLRPLNLSVSLARSKATVSWTPQKDSTETTATPTYYIVYTAVGKGGFDNGTRVERPSFSLDIEPGVAYHFKVSACNLGGESFPSEVVSVVRQQNATATVLVVNGFHRLSSPAVSGEGRHGNFDLDSDIGVTEGLTAGWNGKFIAGNDFNYVAEHALAIASAHKYNVVSCSSHAIETGIVDINSYDAVDLVLGLEKYTANQTRYYKTFSPMMKQTLTRYLANGGKLLVSGAYVGSDNAEKSSGNAETGTAGNAETGNAQGGSTGSDWLSQTLHACWDGAAKTDSLNGISGLGISDIRIYDTPNPDHYCVQFADKLSPAPGAFTAMLYADGSPAAVGYDGSQAAEGQAATVAKTSRAFVMGFPLESITDRQTQANIMRGILAFLLNK